jgi:aminoglycoside 6-adenylyltransferase
MRSPADIKKIILDKANADSRIRAVLLNGSRANSKVEPDQLQDFDIVYIVNNMDSFIADHSWTSIFGEKLIWQLPDEMTFGNNAIDSSLFFHYLILFTDGNRIDLTLFPADKLKNDFRLDSLTVLWLDKDNLLSNIHAPDDADYLIQRPTEKAFKDTCNEFWWVCTYVSKGLLRNEITYAKAMLENPVRKMFMQIIEWRIGCDTNFSVSFGKEGRFMNKYLSQDDYDNILTTYADYQKENIWTSLFLMTNLFSKFAMQVAHKLNFHYNYEEQKNTLEYLHRQYEPGK